MHKDWVSIYKTDNINNAEITKSVLEDNEINVVIMNKKDTVNLHIVNGEIELYVKAQDVIKAKFIISKNKL